MQYVRQLSPQQCKRDALPSELTARPLEIAAFTAFFRRVNFAIYGTQRERADRFGTGTPEIVPNSVASMFRLTTPVSYRSE